MRFFETKEPVRLPAGTALALTPDQFRRRRHVLEPVVDGVTYALDAVVFKAGEVIGLEHVPLALKTALEPVEPASVDLEDLVEGDSLTIDDSIDSASAGEKIEPGVQIQPESGDLAPVSESKLADPTPEPESKPADPTPVPESKPAAKGKDKK